MKEQRSGETERFDKVLALWLDLQWALNFRNDHHTLSCIPTHCPDPKVLEIWSKLISPRNAAALPNLLKHLPDGPQVELIQRAISAANEASLQE